MPSRRTLLKLGRDAIAVIAGLLIAWGARENIDLGSVEDPVEGGLVLALLFLWRLFRDDVAATASVLKR
jgi:hypothetical protein